MLGISRIDWGVKGSPDGLDDVKRIGRCDYALAVKTEREIGGRAYLEDSRQRTILIVWWLNGCVTA